MTKNRPTTKDLARMRASGMTQTQIGEKYGVTQTAVWQWIAADRPHFDNLLTIYTRKLEQQAKVRKERELAEVEAELDAQHEE